MPLTQQRCCPKETNPLNGRKRSELTKGDDKDGQRDLHAHIKQTAKDMQISASGPILYALSMDSAWMALNEPEMVLQGHWEAEGSAAYTSLCLSFCSPDLLFLSLILLSLCMTCCAFPSCWHPYRRCFQQQKKKVSEMPAYHWNRGYGLDNHWTAQWKNQHKSNKNQIRRESWEKSCWKQCPQALTPSGNYPFMTPNTGSLLKSGNFFYRWSPQDDSVPNILMNEGRWFFNKRSSFFPPANIDGWLGNISHEGREPYKRYLIQNKRI